MKALLIRIGAALLAVLGAALLFAGCNPKAEPERTPEIEEGIRAIRALEERSPEAVDERLKQLRVEELIRQRDDMLRVLDDNPNKLWSFFEDWVMLGDSRTCGFMFRGVLDNNRILAGYGDMLSKIETHMAELEQYNPSYIYMCYGLNDIVLYDDPEAFAADYQAAVEKLQQRFPNAKIFVNSIFPCTHPAEKRWKVWANTEPYSKALEQMCTRCSAYFISNSNIESFAPYWQDDGIHFTGPFYDVWGKNMIVAMLDSELGIQEADGGSGEAPDAQGG